MSARQSSLGIEEEETRRRGKIKPNPVKGPSQTMTGRMRYRGGDTVIPKDCCITSLVWIMIAVPSIFILSIV